MQRQFIGLPIDTHVLFAGTMLDIQLNCLGLAKGAKAVSDRRIRQLTLAGEENGLLVNW